MSDLNLQPVFHGSQPATDGLACGTRVLSVDGYPPCGETAAWHVLWQPPVDGQRALATLACPVHMAQSVDMQVWCARHAAGPACAAAAPVWRDNGCVEA